MKMHTKYSIIKLGMAKLKYCWRFGSICLTIKCMWDENGCEMWHLRNSFLKDAHSWGENVINIRKDVEVGAFDYFDKEE
jgi:hypothetical protein